MVFKCIFMVVIFLQEKLSSKKNPQRENSNHILCAWTVTMYFTAVAVILRLYFSHAQTLFPSSWFNPLYTSRLIYNEGNAQFITDALKHHSSDYVIVLKSAIAHLLCSRPHPYLLYNTQ